MWVITTEGRFVNLDGVTEITFVTDLEGGHQIRAQRGDTSGVMLADLDRSPDMRRQAGVLKQAIEVGLREHHGLCNLRTVLAESAADAPEPA